jgi:hypothetical protein
MEIKKFKKKDSNMQLGHYLKLKNKILEKFENIEDDCIAMEKRIAEDFLIKSCDTKLTSSKVSTAKTDS